MIHPRDICASTYPNVIVTARAQVLASSSGKIFLNAWRAVTVLTPDYWKIIFVHCIVAEALVASVVEG
jgi:hypothetical protein